MTRRQRLDLYLNTSALGIIHAADVVLVEDGGALQQLGFRYRRDYLSHPHAFAIDPEQLPLAEGETVVRCTGGVPAFLDDYLPDAWGRRVLTKLALYRDKRRFNAHSAIDTLAMLSNSRIGALSLMVKGQEPLFDLGHNISALQAAEQAAQQIDQVDFQSTDMDEMSLLYLANAGTGVGGARPKALLYDAGGAYLAKFNRQTQDAYNNARVELACAQMARAAGLNIHNGRIARGINQREVLLLERFDVRGENRHHLISANGLLKDKTTQRDPGHSFRYDDLHTLLTRHSITIEQDLEQLLALMLFNRAINNTDDHERNFSLIHRGEGFQLAPAYDLTPNLAGGEYHAAGFQYSPYPPKPSEAEKLGRIFGLPKTVVREIAERVGDALEKWLMFAEDAGLSEAEATRISACFHR